MVALRGTILVHNVRFDTREMHRDYALSGFKIVATVLNSLMLSHTHSPNLMIQKARYG